MKIKNLLLLSIIILNIVSIKAFIVKLETLEHNSADNKQFIIKAGDAHFCCQKNSSHPTLSNLEIKDLNKKNALALVNFSKQLSKYECLFLVEDMYHPQGKDDFTDTFFSQLRQKNEDSNFTNCMSYINDLTNSTDLNVENFEFRHSVYLYAKGHTLTKQFLNSIYSITSEIKNYNDNSTANEYYKDLVNTILNNNKEILNTLNANKDKNIDQIEEPLNKEELKTFRADFNNFVFDYYLLIDAKIIHTILQNKDKKYIFICAGNNHLDRINEVLNKLNYNQKYISADDNFTYPINLEDSLNQVPIISAEIPVMEFPYISIFVALIFILSIRFPTSFRILHLHRLNLNSKMEKLS